MFTNIGALVISSPSSDILDAGTMYGVHLRYIKSKSIVKNLLKLTYIVHFIIYNL